MSQLKRTIGLPLLLFFGLGNILGAGIYVLIGKVAGTAGLYTPLAFFAAATVAAFSAFSYSELSARYPLSAGEAIYIDEGFHFPPLSRFTGLLIAFAGMVSAATISRGFFGYFDTFVQLPELLVITVVVLTLGCLMIWGISESLKFTAVLTLIELGGLLLIIWVGKGVLADVPDQLTVLLPPFQLSAWIGVFLGAFLAFFAFIGFEDMVNIAEEVKNPQQTLPRAILLALICATLIYALVALIAVLSLDMSTLSASNAPLADVLSANSAFNPKIISLIGMFAVVNGALIQMIMASRIFYGMAQKGWLWTGLATVNTHTRTPIYASLLAVTIVLGLALWFPLELLAKATSFLVLVVFALVNAALVNIKRTQPRPKGVLDVPMWVPVMGCGTSSALLLIQVLAG